MFIIVGTYLIYKMNLQFYKLTIGDSTRFGFHLCLLSTSTPSLGLNIKVAYVLLMKMERKLIYQWNYSPKETKK